VGETTFVDGSIDERNRWRLSFRKAVSSGLSSSLSRIAQSPPNEPARTLNGIAQSPPSEPARTLNETGKQSKMSSKASSLKSSFQVRKVDRAAPESSAKNILRENFVRAAKQKMARFNEGVPTEFTVKACVHHSHEKKLLATGGETQQVHVWQYDISTELKESSGGDNAMSPIAAPVCSTPLLKIPLRRKCTVSVSRAPLIAPV
jgi:hypothetical protein